MLLYLQDNDELFNTELFDSVATAEIPDQNLYQELYQLVKQHMIYGPWGYQNLNSPYTNEDKNYIFDTPCGKFDFPHSWQKACAQASLRSGVNVT